MHHVEGMNPTLKAKGQARHRFWGEYSQVVVLVFADSESASLALPTLHAGFPAWAANDAVSLFAVAAGDDVQKVEDQLVSLGARREAIGSLKYSVDFGEVFEVAIPFEDPRQAELPFS